MQNANEIRLIGGSPPCQPEGFNQPLNPMKNIWAMAKNIAVSMKPREVINAINALSSLRWVWKLRLYAQITTNDKIPPSILNPANRVRVPFGSKNLPYISDLKRIKLIKVWMSANRKPVIPIALRATSHPSDTLIPIFLIGPQTKINGEQYKGG